MKASVKFVDQSMPFNITGSTGGESKIKSTCLNFDQAQWRQRNSISILYCCDNRPKQPKQGARFLVVHDKHWIFVNIPLQLTALPTSD